MPAIIEDAGKTVRKAGIVPGRHDVFFFVMFEPS
jgi:hypothetical protein